MLQKNQLRKEYQDLLQHFVYKQPAIDLDNHHNPFGVKVQFSFNANNTFYADFEMHGCYDNKTKLLNNTNQFIMETGIIWNTPNLVSKSKNQVHVALIHKV